MRGLVVLTFALGAYCLAPILDLNATSTVGGSYVIVLKNSLTKAGIVSHMERANLILASSKAKSFEIDGFKGYNVKTTAQAIQKLAQSDDVNIIPYICNHFVAQLGISEAYGDKTNLPF